MMNCRLLISGIFLHCVLVSSELPRSTADGGYEYDYSGEESGVYANVSDDPETKCNCIFDRYDDDEYDDEMNCSDQDDGFERAFRCKSGIKVFLGGKCRNESSKFSHFCDGIEICPDEEPRETFGFKCPIFPALETPELSKESCTIPQKYITRWRGKILTNSNIVHAICPNGEDICFQNGTTLLNTSKCYQCIDGDVININQVCDGKADCRDLSDECLCQNRSDLETKEFCNDQTKCLSNQIAWKNNSGKYQCIDIDGMETMDLDYEGCPHCTPKSRDQNIIECDGEVNGLTALKTISCDKRPRCPERLEDECEKCAVRPEYCNYYWQGMIHCEFINETKRHMPNEFLLICDGRVDCKNGIDENGCNRHNCSADGSRNHTYDPLERCDSKTQCPSGEDEWNCDKAFYCSPDALPWLPLTKVGDGHFDCTDGVDECNYNETSFSSEQDMIKYPSILVLTWIMAIVAMLGNAMVIHACSKDLHEAHSRGTMAANRARVGVCNKILVLNLAVADFLMGVYLMILGIKAIEYNGIFCFKWQEWRSSTLCSGIGALAMLSSQASVLIMVAMTTHRSYSMWSPFRTEGLKAKYLFALVLLFCWLPPLFIAFFPLRDRSMAFAFQPKTKLPHFTRFMIEKSDMEEFLKEALNSKSNASEKLISNQWMDMIYQYKKLFPIAYGSDEDFSIVSKWYGYYTADSVCLPRLFPHIGDNGWEYTAGVIMFDFLAFLYVLLAYTLMYVCTVRRFSTSRSGSTTFGRGSSFNSDEVRSREDRVIWRRISRLILTDFICWMPVCITCIVSLSGHNVPPLMYQISAILFIPVNSALNPLLYSNAVYRKINRLLNKCSEMFQSTVENSNRAAATPSTASRAIGLMTSGPEETRLSRDILQLENRSMSISEIDKNRNIQSLTEMKPLIPQPARQNAESDAVTVELPKPAADDEKENTIMHNFRRFFSERKANRNRMDDGMGPPRKPRPKSQSTTSTGTTFTSCGEA